MYRPQKDSFFQGGGGGGVSHKTAENDNFPMMIWEPLLETKRVLLDLFGSPSRHSEGSILSPSESPSVNFEGKSSIDFNNFIFHIFSPK